MVDVRDKKVETNNSNESSMMYILAGLYNFSIIIFSKGFSNELLDKYDREHFNLHGVISILLWGLAYISVYNRYKQVSGLNFVFAIEKFYYVYIWINWMKLNHMNLSTMINEDLLTGLFFSIYGVGDLLFGLFFLYNSCSNCSDVCSGEDKKENISKNK